MSLDEDLRDLERQVREGDESARVLLTFRRIRHRQGYILAWEGMTVGVPVFWVFTKNSEGVRRRRKKHGVAILDLDDLYCLVRKIRIEPRGYLLRGDTPFQGFAIYELESMTQIGGCYPRSSPITSISLDPPDKTRGRSRNALIEGPHGN